MRRGLLIGVLLTLLMPAVAQAEPYLSKRQAERDTRQVVRERYGDDVITPAGAYCHPQGLAEPEPGYIYRHWICSWAAESEYMDKMCFGRLRISGDRENGYYRWSVRRGMWCTSAY